MYHYGEESESSRQDTTYNKLRLRPHIKHSESVTIDRETHEMSQYLVGHGRTLVGPGGPPWRLPDQLPLGSTHSLERSQIMMYFFLGQGDENSVESMYNMPFFVKQRLKF
jgi:hypothetical protein